MEMKHTPGPWHYKLDKDADVFYVTGRDGQTQVGALQAWSNDEGLANARLIAAAPELLEALVFVEERLTRSGYPDEPNLQTLRAAITKATGE